MKKIAVLLGVIFLFIIGCSYYYQQKREILQNLASAYQNRENLQGYTKTQILRKFGKPQLRKSYLKNELKIETWVYQNIYSFIEITFIKGVVTKVIYK
ncbi:MAG: hypothetical protein DRP61_03390 [Candidatus Omnitrophota bacterium]|nr:MAG: hypothetical protein DRP61_03390 [Candidatus Omnitrophota bacterium]